MNAKTLSNALILGMLLAIAPAAQADKLDDQAAAIIKRDFHDRGIAKADRVNQDKLQAICSKYADTPPKNIAKRLEAEQMKALQYPADGKYMGDWKAGEKLAQSGKGLTWSDAADEPAGGNCYNCHQIAPQEIAFGTIGPSLFAYGKVKGNSEEVQRKVYAHIYNPKAFKACAKMPRFGANGILTEAQIKDLVALLLDPQSPVNP